MLEGVEWVAGGLYSPVVTSWLLPTSQGAKPAHGMQELQLQLQACSMGSCAIVPLTDLCVGPKPAAWGFARCPLRGSGAVQSSPARPVDRLLARSACKCKETAVFKQLQLEMYP